jgi:hypothetical protein
MKDSKNKRDLQKEKNENYVVNEHLYKKLDIIAKALGTVANSIRDKQVGERSPFDPSRQLDEIKKKDKEMQEALERSQREQVQDEYTERALKQGRFANWMTAISVTTTVLALLYSLALFYFYNLT